MNTKILASLMVVMLVTTGCVTSDSGRAHESAGTVIGAVAGGLIGNQFGSGAGRAFATIGGAVLGGAIGSQLGKNFDDRDRRAYESNRYQALNAPVGREIVWNNPNNGNSIVFEPTREGRARDGRYCREYRQEIIVGGRREEAYGQACRNPDGSWEIQN